MFQKDLEYGKNGEREVCEYLTSRGYILYDVSLDAAYQKKDIDFVIKNQSGQCATLEVKSDKFSVTGNFYIEDCYMSSSGLEKLGWLHYCEAEFLCYYDQRVKQGYILDFKKVKQLVLDKAKRIEYLDCTHLRKAYGYLLSIEDAQPAIVFEWSN